MGASLLTGLDDRLHTVDETSGILKLSRASLYREVRDGRLCAFRLRGRLRFSSEQIRAYVESRGAEDDAPIAA